MSVTRNDPCPCGSGRKYKKCCLGKEPVAKVKARRTLGVAWGVVAVVGLAAGLFWGTPIGIAVALAGTALVGAWILMHDHSHVASESSGGIMGTGSGGAGSTDPRTRASGPPAAR